MNDLIYSAIPQKSDMSFSLLPKLLIVWAFPDLLPLCSKRACYESYYFTMLSTPKLGLGHTSSALY